MEGMWKGMNKHEEKCKPKCAFPKCGEYAATLKSKPHHSETETQLEIMLDEFKEKFDTLIGGLKKP